jgi:hypothetical protein
LDILEVEEIRDIAAVKEIRAAIQEVSVVPDIGVREGLADILDLEACRLVQDTVVVKAIEDTMALIHQAAAVVTVTGDQSDIPVVEHIRDRWDIMEVGDMTDLTQSVEVPRHLMIYQMLY